MCEECELVDKIDALTVERDAALARAERAEELSSDAVAVREENERLRKRLVILGAKLDDIDHALPEWSERPILTRIEWIREQNASVIANLKQELALAVAHDRQAYPTADAYEKVCAALEATKAEALRETSKAALAVLDMRAERDAALARAEAAEANLAEAEQGHTAWRTHYKLTLAERNEARAEAAAMTRNVEECWTHLTQLCEIESRAEWETRYPGQGLSMALFAALSKRETKAEAEASRLRALIVEYAEATTEPYKAGRGNEGRSFRAYDALLACAKEK